MIEYLGRNVAVIAANEEEFRAVVKMAVDEGFTCRTEAFCDNAMSSYGDQEPGIDLCRKSLAYCSKAWFTNNGYTVLPASQFIKSYYIIY